jgi:hypothetical protein
VAKKLGEGRATMIELECEVSGLIFQGTKNRPITICPECAGKLRKRGLGPVQQLGKPKMELLRNPSKRIAVIKRMKDALGY